MPGIQLREAAQALLDYFDNGGPDTPIRTTWPDGVECWEAPADHLRPLLLGIERAMAVDQEDR